MIKEGSIVRYAERWCSPGERKYLHVVKEMYDNGRCLIITLNSKLTLQPTELVELEMIEEA